MLAGQKKNLIAVAKNWYHQFSIHTLSLIQGNKSVCGFHLGYLDGETELITQAMNTILDLYKEGKIKPRIDSTWHFEQVGLHFLRTQMVTFSHSFLQIFSVRFSSSSSRYLFIRPSHIEGVASYETSPHFNSLNIHF